MPAIYTAPQRQRALGVHDSPQRPQHTTFIILLRGGDSGAEDHLAPVCIDVGGQEGDPFDFNSFLDVGDQVPQGCANPVQATLGDGVLHAVELYEGDGRDPVFRFRPPGRQEHS